MTRAWVTLESVPTPEGALDLRERPAAEGARPEYLVTIDGRVLMSSTAQRSEQALATLGLAAARQRPAPRVLVGGLGMAITLRAALDALPADAVVHVVELNPVVSRWCAGPLAALTDAAVSDPRVTVVTADVSRVIADSGPASWDAILLDLYEGPHRATQQRDDPFYGPGALGRARSALKPSGILAIWGEEPDPTFPPRFEAAGFSVTTHRPGRGGRAHVVYIGAKGAGGRSAKRRS